jgi:hypothetical protein
MIQGRIRPDGARELRDTEDGVVVQVPQHHGLPADSAFPMVCREEVFARYISTNRFDLTYLEALRYMAAIHDILAICERTPPETTELLERAVGSLGVAVLKLVPLQVFDEMAQRITEATTSVSAADAKDWHPLSHFLPLTPLVTRTEWDS